MVALPPVAKVVRVDFHMLQGSDSNIQNRSFFQYQGALSQADADTWCAAFATQWGNHTMLHLSGSIALEQTVLTDLTSASAPQSLSTTVISGGGGAGVVLAGGTCAVVKKRIARRYRGGHPRDYIGGLLQSALSSPQLLTGGFITNLTNDYNAFVTAVLAAVPAGAAPASEVNVSYFSGFTNVTNPISGRTRAVPRPRVTPVVDLITAHSVNAVPASQRRRN